MFEGGAMGANSSSTLSALSALLTLQKAKDELGFEPSKFSLSEKQAMNIALAFSVSRARELLSAGKGLG